MNMTGIGEFYCVANEIHKALTQSHRIGADQGRYVVAEDLEGEDLYLRNQIIQFIEFFELVQDEISQYLLKEKGIVYTEDMKYEAFYDKIVDMTEVLKEKIDEEKDKNKNSKQ